MHACGNVYRKLCPMWALKTLIRLCWSKRKDLSSFYWILLCYPSCSSKGNTVGPNKPRSKQNLIYYKVGVELLGKLASLKFISYVLPQSIIDQFVVWYCGRFMFHKDWYFSTVAITSSADMVTAHLVWLIYWNWIDYVGNSCLDIH